MEHGAHSFPWDTSQIDNNNDDINSFNVRLTTERAWSTEHSCLPWDTRHDDNNNDDINIALMFV